jgi:hypothetical protein
MGIRLALGATRDAGDADGHRRVDAACVDRSRGRSADGARRGADPSSTVYGVSSGDLLVLAVMDPARALQWERHDGPALNHNGSDALHPRFHT